MSDEKIIQIIEQIKKSTFDDWEIEFARALPISDVPEILNSISDLPENDQAVIIRLLAQANYSEVLPLAKELALSNDLEVVLDAAVALKSLGDAQGEELGLKLLDETLKQIKDGKYPDLELAWIPAAFNSTPRSQSAKVQSKYLEIRKLI